MVDVTFLLEREVDIFIKITNIIKSVYFFVSHKLKAFYRKLFGHDQTVDSFQSKITILKATHIISKLVKSAVKQSTLYIKTYKVSYRKLVKNSIVLIFYLFLGYLGIFTLIVKIEQGGGTRFVNILTSSMYPQIKPGSMIITKKSNIYKNGDIVTYVPMLDQNVISPASTVTHRIIDTKDENGQRHYVTKGDFNLYPDPIDVDNKYVLGKVVFIIPIIGYIFESVRTVPGFIIFVVMPTLVIIREQLIFLIEEVTA